MNNNGNDLDFVPSILSEDEPHTPPHSPPIDPSDRDGKNVLDYETKQYYARWGHDHFKNKEKCLDYVQQIRETREKWKESLLTNRKFKQFDQADFHAGDLNDIYRFGIYPTTLNNLSYINGEKEQRPYVPNELTFGEEFETHLKNAMLAGSQSNKHVTNTFKYIFHKMKKAIYVMIQDNKLKVFLPFSNANFHNNWYHHTALNSEDERILKRMRKLEEELMEMELKGEKDGRLYETKLNQFVSQLNDGKKFFRKWTTEKGIRIGRDTFLDRRRWYANNCFFRDEDWEGDKCVNMYKDMLIEVLKNREIPDVSFFINPRDFPILEQHSFEPYEHLFKSRNTYDNLTDEYFGIEKNVHAPVLSYSSRVGFRDIAIPTPDDWEYISQLIYPEMCNDRYRKENLTKLHRDWESKSEKAVAVFRGSATGCGTEVKNNLRLKATSLSNQRPDLIDCKITSWNDKFKVYETTPYMNIINKGEITKKLGLETDLKKYGQSPVQRSSYKYILNLDGQTSAHRLGFELGLGSVVLLHESEHFLWFKQWIQPYVHYVPVKADLSDLTERIEWCQNNDDVCRQIALNAKQFYDETISTKKFLFDYMQNVLGSISEHRPGPQPIVRREAPGSKFAVIVAYRDTPDYSRSRQLRMYKEYMKKMFRDDFDLYVIEQKGIDKFNLGKLKNIGFMEALKVHRYTHYIISDVDMIPDEELANYYREVPTDNEVISLATRGTVYENPTIGTISSEMKEDDIRQLLMRRNNAFLGGVISVNAQTFFSLNGYPCDFWGWGQEDNYLILRMVENGFKISEPLNGRVIDLEFQMNPTIKQRNQDKQKEERAIEKLMNYKRTWDKNGLSNLYYRIENINLDEEGVTHLVVDILPHNSVLTEFDSISSKIGNLDAERYKEENRKIKRTLSQVKRTRKRINAQTSEDDEHVVGYHSDKIYYYFPDYDPAIVGQMKYDETALFSITKQKIADKMTNILKGLKGITPNSRVLDATSCVGGNTISFSNVFRNVSAIELDETRHSYLKHNLELFGHRNVQTMNTNSIDYLKNLENGLQYEIIFFDPPWGGPEYKNKKNIMLYLQDEESNDISMIDLLNIVKGKTSYLILKVPLNFDFITFSDTVKASGDSYRVYNFDKMAMIVIHFV